MATGIVPVFGRPGIGAPVTSQRLNVSRDGMMGFLPGGGTISGLMTRDPGNAAASALSLRPGLLMGRLTSIGPVGYWANSIIDVTQAAYTSGGTSLTLSLAGAAELVRRIGTSGTFQLVGPPTSGGSNATFTVTFSAVNLATGVVTVTNIGANVIAGAFVQPLDGSQTILSFIPDGYNCVIPPDGTDETFPRIPISCVIDSANLINWPTDTTLQNYVRTSLSTIPGGKFVFSDILTTG